MAGADTIWVGGLADGTYDDFPDHYWGSTYMKTLSFNFKQEGQILHVTVDDVDEVSPIEVLEFLVTKQVIPSSSDWKLENYSGFDNGEDAFASCVFEHI